MKSPVQKLSLDEIEQRAAYEIACGDVGGTVQYPVTAYQVLEALQVSTVCCSFVISVVMYRQPSCNMSSPLHRIFPCFQKSG
jgi:hypothetical protein